MITIEQLKVLPPETEIVITKPKEGDTNELFICWASPIMDHLVKVVTVDELYIRDGSSIKTGDGFTLVPEWLSLKQEEDGLGRLKRTISALRSKKRTKYKTEHDYNRLRQITQAKYDRIKYRARCEGADTVSNDNQFIYNGFLYQQDYPTRTKTNGLVSQYFVSQYRYGTCCMRTRLPKVKLKDVLTRSAAPSLKISDLPSVGCEDFSVFTMNNGSTVKLLPTGNSMWTLSDEGTEVCPEDKYEEGVWYTAEGGKLETAEEVIGYLNLADEEVVNTKGTTLEEDRKINKDWTASHYDNNYTLTEDDIEKGFVRVDAYFVNRMWKINSWDDTGAAFHSLKTYTRIGNNKNTLKRELIALAKQTKALCKLHGVTDEDLL